MLLHIAASCALQVLGLLNLSSPKRATAAQPPSTGAEASSGVPQPAGTPTNPPQSPHRQPLRPAPTSTTARQVCSSSWQGSLHVVAPALSLCNQIGLVHATRVIFEGHAHNFALECTCSGVHMLWEQRRLCVSSFLIVTSQNESDGMGRNLPV
jgi:hypothetical protein